MIRSAKITDAKDIQTLVNQYASEGQMLQVSLNEIYERILEFIIWEENSNIVGVCALHPTWSDMAEIRSLAVHPDFVNNGIGKSLVLSLIEKAKEVGFLYIFALTYKENFFKSCGFHITDIDRLPKKIWTDCLKCSKYPDCDETAVIFEISYK